MSDQNNGGGDVQVELERMKEAIAAYGTQLDKLTEDLQVISTENENDDVSRQIEQYQAACERDPSNIPAEDALDTITRLQNTLKIVKRRNQLLARENATQEKLLRDRSKLLLKETAECESVVGRTGWHEQQSIDFDGQTQMTGDVEQMRQIEAKVRKELRAAEVIIKKKENVIRDLESQVEKGDEVDALLNNVYNDIRVKQRDCREAELQLERMRKDGERNDRALAVYETQRGSASLAHMENDKDFLKDAVAEMRLACRRQDEVTRAQMTRQQQLQARLDTIMRSLREMKLDKEYERNVSKSALVPSASREEPEDVSKILPEGECIPIHTFSLIYKNNGTMRSNVARKDMLVLEKEGVIQALEASLSKYTNALTMTSRQQEDLKQNKELEMDELLDELQQQHQSYIRQLEHLVQENNHLKKKIQRAAPPRSSIKNW